MSSAKLVFLGPISFNTKALLFTKSISSIKDMNDRETETKRERKYMNVGY